MYSIVSLCLFTNISQTLRVYNSKILTINNMKFSFEYVFISVSIYIHLNVYSYECIERFSNFYLHVCDKDCVTSLVLKKIKSIKNLSTFTVNVSKYFFVKKVS